jgi:hypothetical protein
MTKRLLYLVGLSILLATVMLGCMGSNRVGRITPTPTKTPRPLHTATLTLVPSDTPVLPTDTPIPTDTPVPPTDTPLPTDTAVPTEPPPTETAIPPTEVPPSDTPAPPTNTPQPAATKTPPPPTNTPKPRVDFRIREIDPFVDGSTGQSGFHNIYFAVIDATGQPLDNIVLASPETQPEIRVITGTKGPGKAEFTMVYSDYYFEVVGDTGGQEYVSEVTHRLSMIPGNYWWPDAIAAGICSDEEDCRAFGPMHFSYNITFQRTW